MRVLFVGRSVYHFTYYASLLEGLVGGGCDLALRFDRRWSEGQPDVAHQQFLAGNPDVSVQWSQLRRGWTRQLAFAARELRSYGSYLRRPEQSSFYGNRWRRYLAPPLRRVDERPLGRRVLGSRATATMLRWAERALPTVRGVRDDIRAFRPDAVVASPANMRFAEELEYLKAAKRMGIPTAALVLSWDNPSTKGVFHVLPDLLIAWNEAHATDLVRYHGADPQKILISGAPFFDKWIGNRSEPRAREALLQTTDLREDRPFVLYLGSSANIAKDESWLVLELLEHLDSTETLRGASILVRPHPANARPFLELPAGAADRIRVWPASGELPESRSMQSAFRDSVLHAAAIVGINTSAMIDVLLLERPCIAVMVERYEATQLEAMHFRHLLEADALHLAKDGPEAARLIEQVAGGGDSHATQREAFVRSFIRPRGRDITAGAVAADAVVRLAEGTGARAIVRMHPLNAASRPCSTATATGESA